MRVRGVCVCGVAVVCGLGCRRFDEVTSCKCEPAGVRVPARVPSRERVRTSLDACVNVHLGRVRVSVFV